jgi:hypothetical protein
MRFFLLLILFSSPLVASESPPPLSGRVRSKALEKWDKFLNWSVSDSLKTYPLVSHQEVVIEGFIPEVKKWTKVCGYFARNRPIVGKVTADHKDVELSCDLLKILFAHQAKGEYLEIATAEVLSKVVAYRDLKKGDLITIPVEQSGALTLELFRVDYLFDIWKGMPAFGLVPENEGLASILLFRGTDFSLLSQRGWASIMSDLDMAGPGLSSFRKAQGEIHSWLTSVKAQGKTAKVMGFSLGGALAAYTFIYENQEIAESGSITLCAPGVNDQVIEDWLLLSEKRRQGLVSYVNAGDIVSKVGKLFGTVYCLSLPQPLNP